jgi:hypothetical protein
MLSTRVEATHCKSIRPLTPYKLRGTQKAAQEYCSSNSAHLRRKLAYGELYGQLSMHSDVLSLTAVDAFDQDSANERLSREFEMVAADFFSGRPVEAE